MLKSFNVEICVQQQTTTFTSNKGIEEEQKKIRDRLFETRSQQLYSFDAAKCLNVLVRTVLSLEHYFS